MLYVAQYPIFVIFFFGVFAYFLLRMFSSGSRSETREIFEFYLTANEMLRDDERRWYGFELNEAISRGEDIVQRMKSVPPLVHFSLGALQNKVGDHKAAITNLAHIVENSDSDEGAFTFTLARASKLCASSAKDRTRSERCTLNVGGGSGPGTCEKASSQNVTGR